MLFNSGELIRILVLLAERARWDGWLSLEYLTHDDLNAFMSDSERSIAVSVRAIPIFIPGVTQLLSSPDTAGLDHYLAESITGDDTLEELLVAEFLRCVARSLDGAETEVRLLRIE